MCNKSAAAPARRTAKTDCLVLDFAGNVRRFGPVDDPRIATRAAATARRRPRPAPNATRSLRWPRPNARAADTSSHRKAKIKHAAQADSAEILSSERARFGLARGRGHRVPQAHQANALAAGILSMRDRHLQRMDLLRASAVMPAPRRSSGGACSRAPASHAPSTRRWIARTRSPGRRTFASRPMASIWRIVGRRIDGVDYDVNLRRRLALAAQASKSMTRCRTDAPRHSSATWARCPPCARSAGAGPPASATRRVRMQSATPSGSAARSTAIGQRRGSTPCRPSNSMNTNSAPCSKPAAMPAAISTRSARPISSCSERDEWREFLFRLLTGYEQALRRKLLNNEPPLDRTAVLRGTPMGAFETHAESLIERGYAAIPIMPGSKIPGYLLRRLVGAVAGVAATLPGRPQAAAHGARSLGLRRYRCRRGRRPGLAWPGRHRHRHRRCRDQERDRQGAAADAGHEDAARKARPDFSTDPTSRRRGAGTSTASGSAT